MFLQAKHAIYSYNLWHRVYLLVLCDPQMVSYVTDIILWNHYQLSSAGYHTISLIGERTYQCAVQIQRSLNGDQQEACDKQMLLWAFGTYTGKHSKTLQEQSKTSLPFHIVKVNLYYIQRSFGMPVNIYHCAIVVEAHKQAWNKTVQHKRCQRKAGIMNTESSGICSCWCAVKIRLIFSPIKPQELDYSMLN